MSDPIRLLHLTGTPRERGVQYGRALGQEVAEYWKYVVEDIGARERPIDETELKNWVAEKSATAMQAAPELEEEMRGIAEGAEVPYEVALGVVFGEEAVDLAGRSGSYREPTGTRCLSLSVPAAQTESGNLLLAQTWDGPWWNPDPVILVIEESYGIQTFMADPGWNGGAGVNRHGIGSVHTGALIAEAPEGMPYPFISRRILQQADLDGAAASIIEYPATSGCHYIVSDGQRTLDVEAAGSIRTTLLHDGLRSTESHFNSSRAICQQPTTVNPGAQLISHFRTSRLVERAAAASRVTPLGVFALYDDHQEGPELGAVCLHPTKYRRGRTVGTIVIEPATQTIWASAGYPCENRPIRKVSLTDDGFDSEVVNLPSLQPEAVEVGGS